MVARSESPASQIYASLISRTADRFGVPLDLVDAVVAAGSRGQDLDPAALLIFKHYRELSSVPSTVMPVSSYSGPPPKKKGA